MTWERRAGKANHQPATLRDFGELSAAGLLFVADLALWHWSLHLTTVTNSTLLTNCAPVFVAIAARVLLAERLSSSFVGGMLLALVGAVLLVGRSFQLTQQHLVGDGSA